MKDPLYTYDLVFKVESYKPNKVKVTYNTITKITSLYFDNDLFWSGNTIISGDKSVVDSLVKSNGKSAYNALVYFFDLFDTKFEPVLAKNSFTEYQKK